MSIFHHAKSARGALLAVGLAASLASGCGAPHGRTFATPEEAVKTLVSAVRADDRATCRSILGLPSDVTLSTGDEDVDRHNIDEFLRAYDEANRLASEPGGGLTLLIGSSDWPFPFPIVKDGSKWRFDAERGVAEVIARRIGRNELSTIQTCQAIVDAQREYLALNPENAAPPHYADRFFSEANRKNGLYWPTPEGQPPSPLGPLVGEAAKEGYSTSHASDSEPRPYHGYMFRILKGQGSYAPGGALDYVVNGKLVHGFAVIAYPAEYGESGVMSFSVSHAGIVYQADLGPDTEREAKAMTLFDPDFHWTHADLRGAD